MNIEPKNQNPTDLVPVAKPEQAQLTAAKIEAAPTLAEKTRILWALPSSERHDALSLMPATMVAGLIESDPVKNVALLANIPAEKFHEITNLGTSEQGRNWLERAVTTGTLAGSILPSLFTASSLAEMLLTAPDVRRALPSLLNFKRAERWGRMLTLNEYHKNRDAMLMSDVDELLAKASFRSKSIKAVLQSLLDYLPELYLETIMTALERAKRAEDNPDEYEDLTATPLDLKPRESEVASPESTGAGSEEESGASPLADLIPEGGDPVFALATAGLSTARKAELEDQLKHLLRQEIVATASFSEAGMARAVGRVLFYLRIGLESFGPSVEDATRSLELHNLNEISVIGARAAEAMRQKALTRAGLRDWLDARQRQFLDAMKQPEAGVHPETREPVLWLAGKPKQDRAEWHPTPMQEISERLSQISAWAALAHAAFGTPERVHAILNTDKTRTAEEALRRTVISLALYRRWEPELVRPAEDYAAFIRQYVAANKQGLEAVRQIVLDALDQTPDSAWKPSDAKAKARALLLRAIDELGATAPPKTTPSRARDNGAH